MEIIYEDNDIIVLNKPPGVIVNRSKTAKEGTVQDFLEEQFGGEGFWNGFDGTKNSEFCRRTGVVHRLDKDTSGVLVAAKTEESFEELLRQFKGREVQKEYIALVIGEVKEPLIEVNAPIGRRPDNRFKFVVLDKGREAYTRIERVKVLGNFEEGPVTCVRVFPKTGRTHQIRVHLAALGNPVVGDRLYSSKTSFGKWEKVFGRLMLHAYKISFKHPSSNKVVSFEAEIPEEFRVED